MSPFLTHIPTTLSSQLSTPTTASLYLLAHLTPQQPDIHTTFSTTLAIPINITNPIQSYLPHLLAHLQISIHTIETQPTIPQNVKIIMIAIAVMHAYTHAQGEQAKMEAQNAMWNLVFNFRGLKEAWPNQERCEYITV